MGRPSLGLIAMFVPALLTAQTGRGPYARIAVLRPLQGHTVEFEAGYIRHLAWHRQAGDPWTWYGWGLWASDRYRWFVYATFGHSAGSLDSAVAPVDDERDNVVNVVPHAEFIANALYEYLPALSRGTGVPQATARVELTTVELVPGGAAARTFEQAIRGIQPTLAGETLWYRLVAGGAAPRYVRLRPRPSLAAITAESDAGMGALAANVDRLIAKWSVEILNLRPTMSLGLEPSARP
jgi:hypothetical protein